MPEIEKDSTQAPGTPSSLMWLDTHDSPAVAAFQDGETRLLYARDQQDPSGPLVYMPDGRADAMRSMTQQHLECFMPGCADRRLTTVNRAYARHGFRHLSRSGFHTAVSLFHHQATALMCRLIREQYPQATAAIEAVTAGGERRADVLVTWPDDRRLAIEIQYSPMRPDERRARHNSYVSHGIQVLWLYRHIGTYMRPRWRGRGLTAHERSEIQLNSDLREALLDGVPIHWINPIEERIGSASRPARPSNWSRTWRNSVRYDDGHDGTVLPVPLDRASTKGRLHLDDLTTCLLFPDGLITPTDRRLASNTRAIRAVESRRREIDEQWARELEANEQKSAALRAARGAQQPSKPRRSNCSVCGRKLDPWIAKLGHHTLCR